MKPRIIWMIIGGLAIAIALYLIVQSNHLRQEFSVSDSAITSPAASTMSDRTEAKGLVPISFASVSEFMEGPFRKLTLSGVAEPSSVIVLQNRGDRLRQIKVTEEGAWNVTLDIDGQAMVIEALMYMDDETVNVRAEEMIFRIPVPKSPDVAATEFTSDALIMVSAPGSPTRIIQSPFGGSPTNEALTIGAVDYDDAGGVIFSGTTSVPGRIRLYAGNAAIGETRIGAEGRWNFIAGKMLPFGEYIIRAELIQPNAERLGISVPFERLPPLRPAQGGEGALSVTFEPYRWQVRRSLIGGGTQSTVIFAPNVIIPEEDLKLIDAEP
ncbi:hypothetical protein ACJ3XI_08360 [Litorimonas sp. RW-G-Af-16]|uniref:hypothetical protein n=1 Tax=Litorimonas sp. RW-G-Af-16 TaxID=3241168 RepID=UPI00390CAD24